MTVKEFVESYGSARTAAAKDVILKKLHVKEYVDVLQKMTAIQLVVSKANAKYDDNGNVIEKKFNSIMQHISFTVAIVQLYTDLEIDFKREENPDNVFVIYDMLTKSGLIDKIISIIGEKEIGECMLFLNMASSDFAQNEMSLQTYVGERITRATDFINALFTSVSDDMSKKLEGIDVDKLQGLLDDGGVDK